MSVDICMYFMALNYGKMKAGFSVCAVFVAFCFLVCSCDRTQTKKTGNHSTEVDSVSHPQNMVGHADTLLVVTMPEDALWGHLGEGTGMSVLEFITDKGDTLFIYKESEFTGEAGFILGSIRNYTDRFCITTTDSGQTLLKAVNVTQLQELWSDAPHSER